MEATLQQFLTTGVFALLLTFVRFGTVAMIMPGIGDSYVPQNVRLLLALSLSFVLLPITTQYLPAEPPGTFYLITLVGMEFIIGLFFGTIARIFMMALDTAGMIISTASGLANAQVFNPSLASQGSLVGAFLTVTGVVVFFALDLHHVLILGILESYKVFPVGYLPEAGSMAEFIAKTVSASFAVGVKIGAPFIVLTLIIYIGMGVLSRIMPQVQVFLLALPLQILLSIVLLALTIIASYEYWSAEFFKVIGLLLSGS